MNEFRCNHHPIQNLMTCHKPTLLLKDDHRKTIFEPLSNHLRKNLVHHITKHNRFKEINSVNTFLLRNENQKSIIQGLKHLLVMERLLNHLQQMQLHSIPKILEKLSWEAIWTGAFPLFIPNTTFSTSKKVTGKIRDAFKSLKIKE